MIYIILCKDDTQFKIKWRNLMNYLAFRQAYNARETDLYWGWKGYYAKGIHYRPTHFDELLDGDTDFDFQFMSPQALITWKQRTTDNLEYCLIEEDLGRVYNFKTHDPRIRYGKKGYRLILGDQRGYKIITPYDSSGLNDNEEATAQNREDNAMNIKIERVIFSNPATIVIWKDGTKTVAKCRKGDTYSKEAGLAICYMKKVMGSRKKFLKVMKKWIPEEKTKNPREGISFDEYLNEQLKDPEFKKQYENTEIINEEENNGDKTTL